MRKRISKNALMAIIKIYQMYIMEIDIIFIIMGNKARNKTTCLSCNAGILLSDNICTNQLYFRLWRTYSNIKLKLQKIIFIHFKDKLFYYLL